MHFSAKAQKIKKIYSKKSSHILSKKGFLTFRENGTLIFREMEPSSSKNIKFQEGIFRTRKIIIIIKKILRKIKD